LETTGFRMASPEPPGSGLGRRKRVDDNDSRHSSGSSALDSMRPAMPAPRKRRKTFIDAFQGIALQKDSDTGEDGEDADSSQAVADIHAGDALSPTSSIEDPDEDDSFEDRFLSDREEKERKVMLEIVFGPGSEFAPKRDVVDVRYVKCSFSCVSSPSILKMILCSYYM
jgi:hypothetical protein